MDSGTRANIDDVITLSHDIFIMLDDHNGISDLCETLQVGDEHVVVTRMESDRWLIEYVDDPLETSSDLSGETDTLRLPS